MLPILRILPAGGVLLVILILVLALSPPDSARGCGAMVTGRGVLADRDRQSEVRQYLIHAALMRADELNRLRDLPHTPVPPMRRHRRSPVCPATGLMPIRKKPRRPPRRQSSASRSRLANPRRSSCPPSRRRCCRNRRRRRRMHRLSRKPSRPNRGRMHVAVCPANASKHGSRPSWPRIAKLISSKCFSGDRPGQQTTYSAQAQSSTQTYQQPATPSNITRV